MLVAKTQTGELIVANQATQPANFTCPVCASPVRLRHGKINLPHFAHVDLQVCAQVSEGESVEHMQGKLQLMAYYQAKGATVELEVYLPSIKQRADLLVTYHGRQFVVEYQCASVAVSQVAARTQGYLSLQLPVLWILGKTYQDKNITAPTKAKFAQMHGQKLCVGLWSTTTKTLTWEPWQTVDGFQKSLLNQRRDKLMRIQVLKMQQELTRRNPHLKKLVAQLYRQNRLVVGMPWACHALTALPGGLVGNHWEVKLALILALETRPQQISELLTLVTQAAWQSFGSVPLVEVQQLWLNQVLEEWQTKQIVRVAHERVNLRKKLKWYRDYQDKLANLDEFS
ncbi:MAG: hypothetical protein LBT80_04645 [Lactobacillaceae bacterium]|jgi:competence protein CoiA|nr:hypothetical protein [Lactobacillaceae bacterium]